MAGVFASVADRKRDSYEDPARGDASWFTLFSADKTPTRSLCGGIAESAPGSAGLAPHRHAQPEVYYVVSGAGVVTIDGVETTVRAGDAVFIPGDAEHSVRNIGPETLRIFYVFPADRFSDVVYRFSSQSAADARL